jgi:hypothetical protein
VIPAGLSNIDTLYSLDLKNNPWSDFFATHIIREDTTHTLMQLERLKEFIPLLVEKIEQDTGLDDFDRAYPYYPDYKDILVLKCNEYNNSTARAVLSLLS